MVWLYHYLSVRIANGYCSLSTIHRSLCECCAKPKDECKGGLQRKSQDDTRKTENRFESLKVGHHRITASSGISRHVVKPEAAAEEVKGCSSITSPQIVDDALGEIFEIRKGVQVYTLLSRPCPELKFSF